MTYRERFFVPINKGALCDARFYNIYFDNKEHKRKLTYLLNSTLTLFFVEILARGYGGGGGPIDVKVYEVEDLFVLDPSIGIHINDIIDYPIKSFFEYIRFNVLKPIREQMPNPLPNCKFVDDVIFDALGLTEEERKEVYWATAELVKNRLDKARSVKKK
ncbi:hypothetical protein ES705_25701 [subsurface metagenome]